MAVLYQRKQSSIFESTASLLKRSSSAVAILYLGETKKSKATETFRSTDAELLDAMFELPQPKIEARKEDMEKQVKILQKFIDKVHAIQPIPGPASDETNIKLQIATKIQTLYFLSNLEITFLKNASDAAIYPRGYAPSNLLTIRRYWLKQRAFFEEKLEASCRQIEEKKEHICMSETFKSLAGHDDIVFGKWPLFLAEVEWEVVEHP
jgi:hypothetical protein